MTKLLRMVLLMSLCLCLFVGCAGDPDGSQATTDLPAGDTAYSVTVVNLAGTPLANVTVAVYSDETLSDLVYAGKTGNDGVYSFAGPTSDSYVVSLSKIPVGYGAEAWYPLTGEETTISLGIGTMTDADVDTVQYSLGDAVLDFTVTASDGTEHTLSQMLRERDAVVLNFWFMNCGPCKVEFPHLQEAYEQFSDKIAVLALNPIDSDDASIEAFRQENGYTFPMGKCDERWCRLMDAHEFPVTIVVDRYGNISLVHRGSIPDAQTFIDMFAFYSAEDYEQEFFKSVDQLLASQH